MYAKERWSMWYRIWRNSPIARMRAHGQRKRCRPSLQQSISRTSPASFHLPCSGRSWSCTRASAPAQTTRGLHSCPLVQAPLATKSIVGYTSLQHHQQETSISTIPIKPHCCCHCNRYTWVLSYFLIIHTNWAFYYEKITIWLIITIWTSSIRALQLFLPSLALSLKKEIHIVESIDLCKKIIPYAE